MVAIELAYINTKHPDFHKDAALVSSLLKSVEDEHQHQQTRPTSKRPHTMHFVDNVDNGMKVPFTYHPHLSFILKKKFHSSFIVIQGVLPRTATELSSSAGWLASIMPKPDNRDSKDTSTDNTPTASPTHSEISNNAASNGPMNGPSSKGVPGMPGSGALSPQKPVNLLPEVPTQHSRKLSDREKRDCDVIGKINLYLCS